MTWRESVLQAIARLCVKRGSNLFTREDLIATELPRIVLETGSVGVTPQQTLSRELQQLRRTGHIEFRDKGIYCLLQSPIVPSTCDISEPVSAPGRKETTVHRIIRNTELVAKLKRLYAFRCQICQSRIELPTGYYCEVHHLQPVGSPHAGPDLWANMIVICPNHHVEFDYGAARITKSTFTDIQHSIGQRYIAYHNHRIYARSEGAPSTAEKDR